MMPCNGSGTLWARIAHGYRSPTLTGPCSDCGGDKSAAVHRLGQDELAPANPLPGTER